MAHNDPDAQPDTVRTPFTRLEQELICLRRDYDVTRLRVAELQRLVDALGEKYPVIAGMTREQRWGALAGLSSGAVVLAGAIWKLAEAVERFLH